jgi:hypothetical protein
MEESPRSSSPQSDNDVRIAATKFIVQPFQFRRVLGLDILAGHKGGLVRDATDRRTAQVLDVVRWAGAEVEAVGDETLAARNAS